MTPSCLQSPLYGVTHSRLGGLASIERREVGRRSGDQDGFEEGAGSTEEEIELGRGEGRGWVAGEEYVSEGERSGGRS
jgi:hypothetical protein